MAWTVDWAVFVDGRAVNDFMRPYLTEITISDRDGTASDSCQLAFADPDGRLRLPREGASLRVALNGVTAFEGVVDSTPWSMSRGGGRTLSVSAKGRDPRGKSKEGQRWHLDDAPLRDALDKGARLAGLSVVVDPELGSVTRSYWSPDGASFLAWAGKLAKDMGATFKIRGDRAVFARRGAGLSAVGPALPTIHAKIPGNVLSIGGLDPLKGLRRFRSSRVRFFDREAGRFETRDVEIDVEDGDLPVNERRFQAADADDALAMGRGRKSDAEREGGSGSIEMILEPQAQAEGTLVLTGARPGIDGTYRIVSVTHSASRSGGSTTTVEVKQPGGGAGRDERSTGGVPVPTPRPA